jgi:hypothetical protein
MCTEMPSPIAARLLTKNSNRSRSSLGRNVGVKLFELPRQLRQEMMPSLRDRTRQLGRDTFSNFDRLARLRHSATRDVSIFKTPKVI